MIIDYYSWNPGPLGDEVLPEACWPDAKSMVAQLRAEGVELMVSPYFHSLAPGSRPHAQAAARGLLVRDAGTPDLAPAVAYDNANLYDLFQPAARTYAWEQVQRGYIDQYGLRHFWVSDGSGYRTGDGCEGAATKPTTRCRKWTIARAPFNR